MARARYVILGFGPDAQGLLKDLNEEGEVLVLVEDKRSLEEVRNLSTEAEVVPFDELQSKRAALDRAHAIILLHHDPGDMVQAYTKLKELHISGPIVARAPDPAAEERLKADGLNASDVVSPQRVAMERIRSRLRSLREEARHRGLRELLTGADSLVVVIQDTPDPDALASAMALAHIGTELNGEDFRAEIVARGDLGREENRALANLLTIEYHRVESNDELKLLLKEAGVIAMVDCTPIGKNVTFPEGGRVDIVIDHHPVDPEQVTASLVDIQQTVGSTSTILTEYMLGLNIEPHKQLATALLYGVRSDTMGLLRNVHTRDMRAVQALMENADLDLLDRIEHPDRDWDLMLLVANAIKNSKRYKEGLLLVSNAAWAKDPDQLAYVADELLQVAGVQTAIVFGIVNEEVHVKARSKDVTMNVGQLLRDAFGTRGGGKQHQAAAAVPLDFLTTLGRDELERTVAAAIGKLLTRAMQVAEEESATA